MFNPQKKLNPFTFLLIKNCKATFMISPCPYLSITSARDHMVVDHIIDKFI